MHRGRRALGAIPSRTSTTRSCCGPSCGAPTSGSTVAITLPAATVSRAEEALADAERGHPCARGSSGRTAVRRRRHARPASGAGWIHAYAASDSLADQSASPPGVARCYYHLDAPDARYLLGHHVALDADSLGRSSPISTSRWRGGNPRSPGGRSRSATRRRVRLRLRQMRPGLKAGAGGERAAYETLVPQARPASGTHVRLALTTGQADAVAQAARAAGTSPFAIYWAAGRGWGRTRSAPSSARA